MCHVELRFVSRSPPVSAQVTRWILCLYAMDPRIWGDMILR